MSSTSQESLKYGAAKKRVNTTPTWVRKLPRDEIEQLFEQQSTTSSSHSPQDRPTCSTSSRGPVNRPHAHSSVNAEAAKTTVPASTTPPSTANDVSHKQTPDSQLSGPTLLQPAHSRDDVQREGGGVNAGSSFNASQASGTQQDRWWTFTLPQKYLDRVHDYINGQQQQESSDEETDEKGKRRQLDRRNSIDSSRSRRSKSSLTGSLRRGKHTRLLNKDYDPEKQHPDRSMSMSARLAPPGVFSTNHSQTPGWSSPWTPFHREGMGGEDHRDPFTIAQANAEHNSRMSQFEHFVLRNAFAPLLFRFINLVVTTCTLGLAADIRSRERKAGLDGIMGSSTTMSIVVAPIAIVHIFVTVYIEYFGSPIGIWSLGSKMAHTLTELIFICLWSSILSLAFDDLFTSALECTAYTPYAEYNEIPANVTGYASQQGTFADHVCAAQSAVVALVFVQVLLYAGILIVSLFRIFHKVSRKH
ncbi:hypothetical protein OIO90_002409 [Microbotryomycetes sp. JL221]|nr:hypothetical protein OIO90_002409 [Microbotryomycetes sp. JL221]